MPRTPVRRTRRTNAAFRPLLLQLEGRDCPSLSVGPNVNVTKQYDDQNNPSLTINPANPAQTYMASMSWDGGYSNPIPYATYPAGFMVGAGGTAGRLIADGSYTTDALPAASGTVLARPHVAYDQYGNLFLAYNSGDKMCEGGGTLGSNTLSVAGANWVPNQWVGQRAHPFDVYGMSDDKTIVSNTKDTVTVASAWNLPWQQFPGCKFIIGTQTFAGNAVTVAVSTDNGASFRWLKTFGTTVGSDYNSFSTPLVATGPGAGGAGGSVWFGWAESAINVWGAPVTGLGQVGTLVRPPTTPVYPQPGPGQGFGYAPNLAGLSVGPAGQVTYSIQGQYRGPNIPNGGGGYGGGGYSLGKYEIWTSTNPAGRRAGPPSSRSSQGGRHLGAAAVLGHPAGGDRHLWQPQRLVCERRRGAGLRPLGRPPGAGVHGLPGRPR